ncbi:MAG TPA: hypothetical protein VIX18_04085 [Nitrospirota bacterium]
MKRMQKHMAWLLFFTLMLSAGGASASVHFTQNEFTTAESLDPGMTQSGIHFTLGEDFKSYYPEIRYGLGALFEVGVKIGAISVDINSDRDKLGLLVGADLKYQLIKETDGVPLDLAVDLGYDNTIVNRKNASEVTFSTVASKSFALTDRGYKFIPYGGLEMSALYGSLVNDNNTSLYVFGGLEWKLSQKFMLLLELKAGSSTMGGAGIRFEY